MRTTAWWVKVAAAAWVLFVFTVHYYVLLGKLAVSLAPYLRPGP